MVDLSNIPYYTPFDADAADSESIILGGERPPISYVGEALTRDEFTAYVDGLTFDNPPLWMVLHHTAIPSASWAPYPTGMIWDAGEVGLSVARKKAKRLGQLRGIFDHYQNVLGWLAGPQLWADDLFIYIGSPLTFEGIHAAGGNYVMLDGRRRYSLGLEVFGYFEHVGWPAPVSANVAHAVAVLHRKLGTFRLARGKGPGFISEHRDYFKPQCPGAGVKATTYMPRFSIALAGLTPAPETTRYRVLRDTAVRQKPAPNAPIAPATPVLLAGNDYDLGPSSVQGWLHFGPGGFVDADDVEPVGRLTIGLTADSPVIGGDAAPAEELIAAFNRICARKGSPYTRESPNSILTAIGPRYAELCKRSGVRLVVVLAQCAHETGWLTSALSMRRDRDGRDLRNPAGIGVYESMASATVRYRPGTVWDADARGGLGGYRPATQFKDWVRESCLAHVGRLVAYATKRSERTAEQHLIATDGLMFRGLPEKCHGSAPTLRELGSGPNPVDDCGWAGNGSAGGLDYGARLAAAANAILAEVERA